MRMSRLSCEWRYIRMDFYANEGCMRMSSGRMWLTRMNSHSREWTFCRTKEASFVRMSHANVHIRLRRICSRVLDEFDPKLKFLTSVTHQTFQKSFISSSKHISIIKSSKSFKITSSLFQSLKLKELESKLNLKLVFGSEFNQYKAYNIPRMIRGDHFTPKHGRAIVSDWSKLESVFFRFLKNEDTYVCVLFSKVG